jgi:hypothetical protein
MNASAVKHPARRFPTSGTFLHLAYFRGAVERQDPQLARYTGRVTGAVVPSGALKWA